MSIEIVRVSDIELAQLARTGGLRSIEPASSNGYASVGPRATKRTPSVLGGWHYFIGPVPRCEDELAILDFIAERVG